ncbi:MAG: T9SS type A sorting domain-containing protein, partial [Crocinitomicaceae bacterium]|nr:T9SS type A sorting domain-containing protein [Crocinitomicaceae bacterium]
GSSNVRNNYDETTSTFSPVLSANNRYAIYRTSAGVGDLTIVSSSGDAINTTWSYDNGVINTITSPVFILSSVIENYLASGPLTINAGNTTVNAAITSTSTNAFLLNANSTLSNTTPTTNVNAAITNAGSITINTGTFNVAQNISTTSTAAISISATNQISTSTATRRTISTQGGNITINADNDANGSGWLDIDDLTLNPGAGNLIVRGETFNINGTESRKPYINGTGSFTFESNDANFGQDIGSAWFVIDQDANGIGGLTIGKSGSTTNTYLNSTFTVAGPINVYGGYIEVTGTITSSGTNDIFLKGITNSNGSVNIGSGGINKIGGTGTLTLQANGRAINSGIISATGAGVLNVVLWSDFDGDNVGGGSTLSNGSISTNGGHVWVGGSNSNSGSYSWNGLAVGDGPSAGAPGSNCNAIDLFSPITTNGGDVLLWASNGGCGTAGIASDGTRLINAGTGDITFIAYQTTGAIELTSTGVISLLPHAGAYAAALTLGGTLTSGNFTFNTSYYNGLKINSMANSGLVIGNYSGHLSGATSVTQGNSSNVTVSSALSAKSLEIHGGAIALNENITTTGTNADVLIKAISNINLAASKTITTVAGDVNLWADSDDNSVGYVQLLSNTAINSTGGDINLGGGADLTADYAFGTTAETCSEATGTQYISGVHLRQSSSLNSNGGNISVRGQNANTSASAMSFGISLRGVTMNSGTGTIAISGIANGSGSVNAQGVASWGTLTLRSANTSDDAISITGNALSSVGGSSLGINVVALFEATGVGGGITITGKSGVASTNASVNIGGNILAASGPITISGENATGAQDNIYIGSTTTIGKKSGTNVTTSSSNVILEGNTITTPGSVLVDCSGTLTVRPFGNSFSSAITWPMSNVSLASSITGLTIGKPTNTANVTFTNATTINGPITIYGGTLALNENISSSAGSTISLYGNVLNFASGKTVTSSGLLIVAPQNSAGSIGMGGATGTLQLPASYFSTHFTDGFSLIQIGTNSHSSAIASNAFNLRDNMALYTTGSVTLGGKPVLGVNNLTLGSAISSISSGATNYFKTNGTGKVFRNIPDGENLILPIGRAFYNPVTIKNNTGAADDFSALVLDSVFLYGTNGPLIVTPHVKATWDISKTNANAGSGIDFEFGWDLSQEDGTFTSYKLNHHATTWSFAEGTSQTPSGTSTKSMSHTDYTGTFSPFAISEGTSALPVELISFNASCSSNDVKITWETASEHNSSHFIVEGSENGILWKKLEDLPASGNSNSLITYEFTVASDVSRAINYYRLTQFDIDGNATQYGSISRSCNSSIQFDAIAVPNPTNGEFALNIYSDRSQEVIIQLVNSEGKIISSEQRENLAGSSSHYMNLQGIAAGIYTLQVYHLNGVLNKKIVIQ